MIHASLKTKMLEAFRTRMYFFVSIVSVFFLILIIQLIKLQLVQGEEYLSKSKMNMENFIPISAPRGEIYDRNFKYGSENVIIVSNRPSFNISTVPAKFSKKKVYKKTIGRLSSLLGIDPQSVYNDSKGKNPWERLIIKEDVSFNAIVKIASHQNLFPLINWEDTTIRVYNYENMFSHVVGYIGSISKREYKRLKKYGYRRYQKIGKAGMEKGYDTLLRGVDGYIRRIVDVRNRTEGEEVGLQPIAGNNLVLTIDFKVQKAASEAMKDHRGSVVVIKASTGEVISLLSKPDFDPNMIISKDNSTIIQELQKNEQKPFLNRAIQSRYPPASTFKLLVSVASLEEEKWLPGNSLYCPGKYTLKGYTDKDFYCYGVHGSCNLEWAIAKSCSVYFYQLGYRIGPTIILKYANYFGLGKETGIDIPGEISGFVPSKKWKMKTFGQSWFDGDTINLSIGQGFLAVTPVALANFICGLVNSGVIYQPHVVKEIRSTDNRKLIRAVEPVKMKEIPLSQLTVNTITKGMRSAVQSGTAMRLRSIKVPVAGKTGTAQTRSKRMDKYSQHAWFVGFAPYNSTKKNAIVVVTMVEYGIAGAVAAVPVAERIFAKLYSQGYFE